MQMANQL